jgi:hypothetical protein
MEDELFDAWVTLQQQIKALKDKLYACFSFEKTLPSLSSFLQHSQQLSPSKHCKFPEEFK